MIIVTQEQNLVEQKIPTSKNAVSRFSNSLRTRAAKYLMKAAKANKQGNKIRAKIYSAMSKVVEQMAKLMGFFGRQLTKLNNARKSLMTKMKNLLKRKKKDEAAKVAKEVKKVDAQKKSLIKRTAEKFGALAKRLKNIRLNLKTAGVAAGVAAAGAAGYYGYKKYKARKQENK